ncbi:glycoside hydrolase family 3 N-terminal domain-containing protein [Pseudothermotoga sp. U03pept]|uniref:glycoside hydrolase family 3 N-terminal domain-containing protein n=1 Tax=Pseudothermotoga sp. U03pept TaxID=3447012 RepID=UPI003F082AC8
MELYKNSKVSAEIRAKDLLSKMTLDEKISQLGSVWGYELLDEEGRFLEKKANELLKHGMGQITRPGGATNLEPAEVVKFVNQIQKYLIEKTRLGIPALIHEECLAGYMGLGATNFPQPIAMASTWDPDLIHRVGRAIGSDMKKIGAHQGLAPVVDVVRDPRWGRTEESFGESPYLVARMGVRYIEGIQKNGVIATTKHYVAYGAAEGGKNWAPSNVAPRELREVFMFPFEAAVKCANVLSVMNSYSEIDGVPCACSEELLDRMLRKEWGFKGIVVSDYFAVDNLRSYHKIAKDKAQAAKLALEAGIDIELPKMDCYYELKKLVESGQLSESVLDEAVFRVLLMKFKLGLFERPYVEECEQLPKHGDLALEVARKSIVLLKNDGILPLKKGLKVALVGPNSRNVRNMFGDYSYYTHIKALLDTVNLAAVNAPTFNLKKVEEVVNNELQHVRDVYDLLKNEGIDLEWAEGCGVLEGDEQAIREAVTLAEKCDVIIAVMGDRSGLTKDCTSGESRDSANLRLPGLQEKLLLELAKVKKPIVLVLVTGRPYALEIVEDKMNAIVEAWLPAEAGGQAIVDVLLGKVNPSGKLPISFPRSAGQLPVFHYVKPSGGRSHWHKDYVDEPVEPLYPFGHGLSYTKFEYSNFCIESKQVPTAGEIIVKVDLKNVGEVAGEEVVQLYVGRENGSVTRPVKELKGFVRVQLEPGQSRTVQFRVHTDVLAYYNRRMELVVEPGIYKFMVGASSADIKFCEEVELVGEERKVPTSRRFFSETEVF